MDINNVNIIGRLTRDPEVRTTNNGMSVCKMSIAVNGMKKDDVSFFDVTAWSRVAENCGKYLKKGSQVGINGSLRQNRFQTKEGQNRSKVEINANNVQFICSKSSSNAGSEQSNSMDFDNDDNLPF